VLGKKLEKLVILLQENGSGKEKSLRIDDVVRTFRDMRSMIGIYKCTLQLGF
jgi:hypothetical protein|tara:strand:+ start:1776 stop:1931 length:156 start_codon:yes stop_codon:yes gene_type:complete